MFNVGFNRFGTTPPVVKNLIYLNIIMFVATWVFENSFQTDLYDILGLHFFKSELFKPMQFITHMFMHGGPTHIFFNMFALWMFGKILESVWGSQRFFIYYVITGLGAAAIHTLVNFIHYSHVETLIAEFIQAPSLEQYQLIASEHFSRILKHEAIYYFNIRPFNSSEAIELLNIGLTGLYNIPTVGASGAVFGVLLAFGMLFPNTELMLLFPPIPIKAKWFVMGYGAIELFLGLQQPGSNIAHFAHLGGMLFGFILIKYWKTKRSNFY
jgi:membrane associated rhomboid family serine protease